MICEFIQYCIRTGPRGVLGYKLAHYLRVSGAELTRLLSVYVPLFEGAIAIEPDTAYPIVVIGHREDIIKN